jgi:ABC-type branched-subunit amino acid transport system substrate-binding protein
MVDSPWFATDSRSVKKQKQALTMWKRIICGGIVSGAAMTMLACLALATEPVKIGMVASHTGPGAESGRNQTQGAELAVGEVNKAGGILGRQIETVVGDDQTTNPGAVVAFENSARTRTFLPSSARFEAPRSTPSRRIFRSSANR